VPPNAHIRINGHSYSSHGQPTFRIDVPGGEHKVQVTAGHLKFEQRVRVAAGATAEVIATSSHTSGAHAPDVPHLTPPFAPPAAAGAPAASDARPAPAEAKAPSEPKPTEAKPPTAKPAEAPHGDYTLDPFK